ncbi:hypothetical protein AUCHE_08_01190 [Austwickia chelonae NBRC 105200]|uniref:Uncharacterized protein n=1 Tax=Austwickia chelonae NBRC 105200 TaxID=1184607 RepID=K6UM78_9MICO|nr:hypothetical protein AUCHE_08_01190 [Austwickia chelonae NBRC 105200]
MRIGVRLLIYKEWSWRPVCGLTGGQAVFAGSVVGRRPVVFSGSVSFPGGREEFFLVSGVVVGGGRSVGGGIESVSVWFPAGQWFRGRVFEGLRSGVAFHVAGDDVAGVPIRQGKLDGARRYLHWRTT